jgi:hypothetical protein
MYRTLILKVLLVGIAALGTTGCRYASNRVADFSDMFILAGGVTAENQFTGPFPPSLGVHVQVTDYLGLGANHFSGGSAQIDGRGLYAGPESRTRLSFLFWNRTWLWEDPERAVENYYKKDDTLWSRRMASMSHRGRPAKSLHNTALPTQDDHLVHPRGWQYWETISAEFGICEPFVTHLGFHFRVGFDPSEFSDFLLGLFLIDFKQDDLKADEFEEARSL